jgi:hypothetical protein
MTFEARIGQNWPHFPLEILVIPRLGTRDRGRDE